MINDSDQTRLPENPNLFRIRVIGPPVAAIIGKIIPVVFPDIGLFIVELCLAYGRSVGGDENVINVKQSFGRSSNRNKHSIVANLVAILTGVEMQVVHAMHVF